MEDRTGIIILAAGKSSRLGRPKQLLKFDGQTLIRRVVGNALKDKSHSVFVVTGANNEIVESELQDTDAILCYNNDWEKGMGSSIKSGLKHLLLVYPDIEQCIICVCDQPYADDAVFRSLKQEQLHGGNGIVACSYAGTLGVPVLFTRTYFDALLNLKEQEGAKKLINKYSSDVSFVPFEPGAIDIDTIDDYNQLTQLK